MIIFRSFNRTKISIIITLALLLLAPSAFASQLDAKRQELQNINAQIQATQSKQDDAAKRQAEVQQQLQQSTDKMVQIQRKLNTTQSELNNVIAKKQDTEARLDDTQKKLDGMQVDLAAAKDKLAERRQGFNKRLISSYKNREQNVIIVLLDAENFRDLITRLELIHMIATQDSRLVSDMKQQTALIANQIAQVETVKKALDEQRQTLVAEKKRIDAITRNIIAQQQQLQGEMVKQQQLYAQIQQEKEQLAQAAGALKATSSIVAGQVRALEMQNANTSRGSMRAANAPADLKALAEKSANKYGIPPKLFFALITQESGWNYRAVSRTGAIGLTQIMPFNVIAMGYNLDSFRNSPADQLDAGARYLSWQYKTFGRWDYALAAYNAGPGAVMMYGGIPPYAETQSYVRNILAMAGM